jgi:hypothetical protein
MPRRASLSGYCAMVRTPLRSPTSDAAVPPAFATPPLPLASWHSFLLAPQASVPISADHCLLQKAPECSAAPCTIIVRRYRPPSLLIFFCGSLSPEFLRPGFNPRKQPTSRLFRNRCGSSIVRTYVSAICVPTPFTCLSKDTSGYTSLAIFSIRSSYSWTPLVQRFDFFEQRLQNIPQLGAPIRQPVHGSPAVCHTRAAVHHKTSPTRVLRSPRPFEHSPVQLAPGLLSDGFALAHCDAAPAPIARDRFAPVVPVSAHRVDPLFDCSW